MVGSELAGDACWPPGFCFRDSVAWIKSVMLSLVGGLTGGQQDVAAPTLESRLLHEVPGVLSTQDLSSGEDLSNTML